MSKKLEYRAIAELQCEERADGGRSISGYAAVFNKLSEDLGGFREKIDPGAFARALKENPIYAIRSHDSDLLLAGTVNSTLKIEENARGLKFEMWLDDTEPCNRTWKEIKSGLLRGMSFGFWLYENGDSWERTRDGQLIRTLHADGIDLREISTTAFPAYPQTSVSARSLKETLEEGLSRCPAEILQPALDGLKTKIRAHDLRSRQFSV